MRAIAKRGCGYRVAGGIYVSVGLSPDGKPVEHFLFDPPRPVDASALGLSPRGVTPLEIDGVTHVFDWVGSEHYKLVPDFAEEVRRLGLSRRIPRSFPFEQLTPESRIVLLHRRAYISNYEEFYQALPPERRACPKRSLAHDNPAVPETMCAALWWHDLAASDGEPARGDHLLRTVPSGPYLGRQRPANFAPEYELAMFASFSAAHLVVINDEEGGSHEAALEAARRSAVRVTLEDA